MPKRASSRAAKTGPPERTGRRPATARGHRSNGRSRGPPRRHASEELRQAIFAAATAELLEYGYPRFTMDRVAVRAKALYRRWPNKAGLALDDVIGPPA